MRNEAQHQTVRVPLAVAVPLRHFGGDPGVLDRLRVTPLRDTRPGDPAVDDCPVKIPLQKFDMGEAVADRLIRGLRVAEQPHYRRQQANRGRSGVLWHGIGQAMAMLGAVQLQAALDEGTAILERP